MIFAPPPIHCIKNARDGYSLAYREDEIKAYCQAQGYTLLCLIKDEGISGAKVDEEALEVNRLGFQEMYGL